MSWGRNSTSAASTMRYWGRVRSRSTCWKPRSPTGSRPRRPARLSASLGVLRHPRRVPRRLAALGASGGEHLGEAAGEAGRADGRAALDARAADILQALGLVGPALAGRIVARRVAQLLRNPVAF